MLQLCLFSLLICECPFHFESLEQETKSRECDILRARAREMQASVAALKEQYVQDSLRHTQRDLELERKREESATFEQRIEALV